MSVQEVLTSLHVDSSMESDDFFGGTWAACKNIKPKEKARNKQEEEHVSLVRLHRFVAVSDLISFPVTSLYVVFLSVPTTESFIRLPDESFKYSIK